MRYPFVFQFYKCPDSLNFLACPHPWIYGDEGPSFCSKKRTRIVDFNDHNDVAFRFAYLNRRHIGLVILDYSLVDFSASTVASSISMMGMPSLIG